AGIGDLVAGNLIGLDKTGTIALNAHQGTGLDVNGASNTVGGLSPNARNVISGNGEGIIIPSSASNNRFLNNDIGTDITGAVGLGNATYGVQIASAGANNVFGAPGAGNVVAASGSYGLLIQGAPLLVVQGNKVGTNAAGTAALPNLYGFVMQSVDGLQFGGTAPGSGNLVSG